MGAMSGARILPAVLAAVFLVAGCASPEPQQSSQHRRFRVGQPNYTVAPYQVNGTWYYPKVDYNYDETGTASWYGPGFDGRPTSDGEIYDMNQLTAAHKTLPLPSVVRVTNLQNGRAVQLRVNDRGPFVDGRLIDLSRRSAQLLGFEGSGTAPVRVQVMKEESIQVAQAAMHGQTGAVMVAQLPAAAASTAAAPPPTRLAAAGPPSLRAREVIAAPLPAATPPPTVVSQPEPPPPSPPPSQPALASVPHHSWPSLISSAHAETLHLPPTRPAPARKPGRFFVQAGAYAMAGNAQRARTRLASLGGAEIVHAASAGGSGLYKVRVGPVTSETEAVHLLNRVVGSGYPGARVVAN